MPDLIRRDVIVQVKVERDLARALDTAARQRGQSRSEFTRQCVRAQLAATGVALPPFGADDGPRTPPAAPALRSAA